MRIISGSGIPVAAKVDSNERVHTLAVGLDEIAFITRVDQLGFKLSTGMILGTVTEGMALFFQNTHDTMNFVIDNLLLNADGGNTTFIKNHIFRLYTLATVPTSNTSPLIPVNMNTGSGKKAAMTCYKWNGSSTGMTGGANGTLFETFIASKGISKINLKGSLILAPNTAGCITIQCEEAGDFSVGMSGYFDDAEF